jgi:hypothetical protein
MIMAWKNIKQRSLADGTIATQKHSLNWLMCVYNLKRGIAIKQKL